MKTTSLQIRIPATLRRDADRVLEAVGMDMSTAVKVYLAKIVNTKSIPFTIEAPREDSDSCEFVPVDDEMQAKMDKVASLWNDIRKKSKNK